jgi:hypothetical protein
MVKPRRKVPMEQFRLFPPLGVVKEPLPDDALREARELLAELLAGMLEPTIPESPDRGGSTDE